MIVFKPGRYPFGPDGKVIATQTRARYLKRQGFQVEFRQCFQAVWFPEEMLAHFYSIHVQKRISRGNCCVLVRANTREEYDPTTEPSVKEVRELLGIALEENWQERSSGLLGRHFLRTKISQPHKPAWYAVREYFAEPDDFAKDPATGKYLPPADGSFSTELESVIEMPKDALPASERQIYEAFKKNNCVIDAVKKFEHIIVVLGNP